MLKCLVMKYYIWNSITIEHYHYHPLRLLKNAFQYWPQNSKTEWTEFHSMIRSIHKDHDIWKQKKTIHNITESSFTQKKINIHLWDYESTNQNWTQFSLVQLFLLTRFIGPITSAGSTTKPPINSVLSGDSWLVFGRQNS